MIDMGCRDLLIDVPQEPQSLIFIVWGIATGKQLDLAQQVELRCREYRVRVPKGIISVCEKVSLQKVTLAVCQGSDRALAGSPPARRVAVHRQWQLQRRSKVLQKSR
jgi:hypothetical protein